ncbi:Zinc-binding dehydrogenase [Salmonella enterica subsp. arizonae]|uniref:Zinc-binding dehydrogenase n=1 Tax=Salmonella enterica subsp. arizonae TaxID=59203 RepID=A0A379TB65_SALER|nr:Zinc-binding dehydrogenase [Salmonella enterica subsp. arizonae]
MKKLIATQPRVAALVEYEDRAILENEVKIRVLYGAPKHWDLRWSISAPPVRLLMRTLILSGRCLCPRPEGAPRGIEFGKFPAWQHGGRRHY